MTEIRLFNKFTERAKKAISLAQEEAAHLQHNAIGSEHLLLGLIREEESIAARVLEGQGMTLEKVRKAVKGLKGRDDSTVQGDLELTEHARATIDMAIKEADKRHPRTEYPLLGTSYMQESEAEKILQNGRIPPELEVLGVTLEIVSKAVEKAKELGNSMVAIQIETGMAPYAQKPESGEWHHPLLQIDTTNLLLGLLRVPESTGSRFYRRWEHRHSKISGRWYFWRK